MGLCRLMGSKAAVHHRTHGARCKQGPHTLAQGAGEVHVVAVQDPMDPGQPVVQVDALDIVGNVAQLLLLALLLVLKLHELRSGRDGHAVVLLGYFMLLAAFMYSQTPAMAAVLAD